MKAPTPAKVAWQSDTWPAAPVVRVMDMNTSDSPRPPVMTKTQVLDTHVSMEITMSTRTAGPMNRSELVSMTERSGGRIGVGGGSTDARGSSLDPRRRSFGWNANSPSSSTKGIAESSPVDQTLPAGAYPVVSPMATPIPTDATAAITGDSSPAMAAPAMAATRSTV